MSNPVHYSNSQQPKRVLVTGGTRGIGKAIALAFKQSKHDVAVMYVGDQNLAVEMETKHDVRCFQCDVSDFEQCKKTILQITEKLGGNIQVLVNNAGITRDGMLHKQSYKNWMDVISVNLTSIFNLSHLVIGEMRNEKYGRIINISSVNANGAVGQTNYAAAKAGIEGFTKSLALEGARAGITVNAIAPGYTDTTMVRMIPAEILKSIVDKVPMQRLGLPEEIADTAVFLASNSAAFITGAVIPINGGLHM